MDWFKGKSTGNHGFSHQIWCFPVNFPLNQSIDIPLYPHIRWQFWVFTHPLLVEVPDAIHWRQASDGATDTWRQNGWMPQLGDGLVQWKKRTKHTWNHMKHYETRCGMVKSGVYFIVYTLDVASNSNLGCFFRSCMLAVKAYISAILKPYF